LALGLRDGGRGRAVRRGRVGRRLRFDLVELLLGQRGADGLGVGRQLVRQRLELRLLLGHDRLLVGGVVAQRELLVGRNSAVARARQRRVGAALAVREDRRAAAGELLVLALPAERGVGLGLRELRVGLDVDLPAGQAGCEAGVHALLADRERELVVGGYDGRLAGVV